MTKWPLEQQRVEKLEHGQSAAGKAWIRISASLIRLFSGEKWWLPVLLLYLKSLSRNLCNFDAVWRGMVNIAHGLLTWWNKSMAHLSLSLQQQFIKLEKHRGACGKKTTHSLLLFKAVGKTERIRPENEKCHGGEIQGVWRRWTGNKSNKPIPFFPF